MKGRSILLALSDSEQSRQATQVCWQLAGRLNASITAHHVVDTHSAWEFVGHDRPGFLGSSIYLQAYQQLMSSMFRLGETLAAEYAREAISAGVDDVCLLDEGDPIEEICKRSLNHKMVVIGHKANGGKHNRTQFKRLSVAEALAHDCQRPLLIVQDECREWTSLSIMISLDHINEVYINSCLDIAKALDLPPALICLTGGAHEESREAFVADMRNSNERLRDVPLALAPAQKNISVNVEDWYAPDGRPFDHKLWDNTLIVIPTRMVAGERLTVVDSSPSLFVRHLTLPSILLCPEEYVFSGDFTVTNSERELALSV